MDAEGEHEQAATVVEQALPLARESGDLTTAAGALNTLAHFREVQGDYVQALEFYNECLELLAALDDRLNLGVVLGNVGGAALGAGDSQRAIETFEQSLELARELGDNRQVNWSQAYLALARLLQGSSRKATSSSSRCSHDLGGRRQPLAGRVPARPRGDNRRVRGCRACGPTLGRRAQGAYGVRPGTGVAALAGGRGALSHRDAREPGGTLRHRSGGG